MNNTFNFSNADKVNSYLAYMEVSCNDGQFLIYVPKNNKLYTWPFYYIQVTNGAGGSAILKPELWDTSTHQFRIYASLTRFTESLLCICYSYD